MGNASPASLRPLSPAFFPPPAAPFRILKVHRPQDVTLSARVVSVPAPAALVQPSSPRATRRRRPQCGGVAVGVAQASHCTDDLRRLDSRLWRRRSPMALCTRRKVPPRPTSGGSQLHCGLGPILAGPRQQSSCGVRAPSALRVWRERCLYREALLVRHLAPGRRQVRVIFTSLETF